MQSTIHKIEDKLLIELPTDFAAKHGWGTGGILSIDRLENGLKIERVKSAFDHALEIARKGMDQYRLTLQTLAKS